MASDSAQSLGQFLTPDEPFGPIDACELIENPEVLKELFETHNKIHARLHGRPSLVVGRKGSGKTTYLNSVQFDSNYKFVVNLNTSEAFYSVIQSIGLISTGPIFAEMVQQVWKKVIFIGLFNELRTKLPKDYGSRHSIDRYLAKIGVKSGGTIEDVLWQITAIIARHVKDKPVGVFIEILQVFDNATFTDVFKELQSELKENKHRVVILLDSLDDFQLHVDVVGRAIQGLLKFIGECNSPSSWVDLRFCLPAELHHLFTPLSANPDKDFRRKLTLHWTASELIALAAHRLVSFSAVHPDHALAVSNPSSDIEKDSGSILKQIMPTKITTRLGIDEDPIAYLLRHTQLLPRHLLMLLNSVSAASKRGQYGSVNNVFSEEALKIGIADIEGTLVHEIFAAYRPVYPKANEVCTSCLPELFHKFSIGDLERVFRSHGMKSMETDDFSKFKRMLIEIGAVGRVLEDAGRYIRAEFEYTIPNQLVSSTDDMLCIHPLFTKVFAVRIRELKPVYPYGSLLEDPDYRR